ncbi:MAG: hypothetical protein ACREDR_32660, partial [Blastocatellia bacterium]
MSSGVYNAAPPSLVLRPATMRDKINHASKNNSPLKSGLPRSFLFFGVAMHFPGSTSVHLSFNSTRILQLPRRFLPVLLSVLLFTGPSTLSAFASEQDAIDISNNIQQRHMPNGTIIDPVFSSSSSDTIVAYTRGADSAIWTGHYLAAEAFRYKVTGSADALANVWTALNGIRSLRVVTGTDVLARCLVPVNWQFASSIT